MYTVYIRVFLLVYFNSYSQRPVLTKGDAGKTWGLVNGIPAIDLTKLSYQQRVFLTNACVGVSRI